MPCSQNTFNSTCLFKLIYSRYGDQIKARDNMHLQLEVNNDLIFVFPTMGFGYVYMNEKFEMICSEVNFV